MRHQMRCCRFVSALQQPYNVDPKLGHIEKESPIARVAQLTVSAACHHRATICTAIHTSTQQSSNAHKLT